MDQIRLAQSGSVWGPTVGSCEYDNATSDSTKWGICLAEVLLVLKDC